MANVRIKSVDLGTGQPFYPTGKVFLADNTTPGYNRRDSYYAPLTVDQIIELDDDHAKELLSTLSGVLEVTLEDANRSFSRKSLVNGSAAAPTGTEPAPAETVSDGEDDPVLEAMRNVDMSQRRHVTKQGFPSKYGVQQALGREITVGEYRSALSSYRQG